MRLRILMVDDLEEDIFFVRRALDKCGLKVFFHGVKDGQEAISFLQGEGKFVDRQQFPFPSLILTDLKMPGMDGYAFLEWLQTHPACKAIPTIVLSSSSLKQDVQRAYDLGANAFMVKPGASEEMVKLMARAHDFWASCEIPDPPLK
jgi:CheY-like chemotaxis protein